MRELVLAMAELESQLQQLYGVSLNEAMLLCCIGEETLTASVISEHTGLAPSNTSKVLRSIEKKGLINRSLGEEDKRQMRFSLSDKGMETLMRIKREEIKIPEFLAPLF